MKVLKSQKILLLATCLNFRRCESRAGDIVVLVTSQHLVDARQGQALRSAPSSCLAWELCLEYYSTSSASVLKLTLSFYLQAKIP